MMNVRMPDGTLVKNVPYGTTKETLTAKLAAYKTRVFPTPRTTAVISERLGPAPRASPLGVALNVGRGALQAAGDIPAGIEQVAMRYLPFPESMEAASAKRIAEYEREKKSTLAKPGGTAGYIGGQVGTAFLPGAGPMKLAAGAGKLTRAGAAAKPIAIGAGLTALRPHETEGDRAKAAIESAAFGLGGGAVIKGLGITSRGVKRAFTGGEVVEATGERAARAAVADRLGYKLTVGEVSGNKRIRGLEDASERLLGGTQYAKLRAHNKENTNKILSRRIGAETPEITTEWLAKTADDIGREFEAVRALDKTTPPINLGAAYVDFARAAETGRLSGGKKLGSILRQLQKRYPNGMNWNEYADLRSEWASAVIRMQDRDLAHRLGGYIGVLDDAAAKAAPDAVPLKAAASKYREYLLIRNSINDDGDIMLSPFVKGVASMKKGRYHTTPHGRDELVDVARSLSTFQRQLPSSGTAERAAAMKSIEAIGNLPGRLLRLGAGGAGFALGDITGAAGAYAAPYVAQRGLMSNTLRKYLETQAPRTRELARRREAERVSQAIRASTILGPSAAGL